MCFVSRTWTSFQLLMVKKLVDVTLTLRNMTSEKHFYKWNSIISAHFIEAETTTVILH